MRKHTVRRYLVGGIGLGLAVGAWLMFAPRALGGPVAYSIVSGSSMEPKLTAGDLTITRARSDYQAGDIVAYKSDQLNHVVLHRVVRNEGGRLVLKGDNNEWLDSDKPSEDDVIGELWIRLPGVGTVVKKLRQPLTASIVVAVLAAAALLVPGSRRRSRRARHGEPRPRTAHSNASAPGVLASLPRETPAAVLAILTMSFGALAVIAHTRAPHETVATKISYEQRGVFGYSGDVPSSPVYPGGEVTTGDPVYLKLLDDVAVDFAYEFAADAPHTITGTGTLVAEISEAGGWSRTVKLDSGEVLDGGRLTLSGTLDLARLRSLVTNVERLTGILPGIYDIKVTARVDVEGTLADRDFQDTFSSPLSFTLDALHLQPAFESEDGDPARPLQSGTVEVGKVEPASLSLLGATLSVEATRRTGLVGALLCLLVLVPIALPLFTSGGDEVARIQSRYGSRLVHVAAVPRLPASAVEVTSMATLVRIAELYERVILYAVDGDVHHYLVEYDGSAYLYRASVGTSEESEPSAATGSAGGHGKGHDRETGRPEVA